MPKPSEPPEVTDRRCGFWASPLSAKQVTQASVALDQIQVSDDAVYWRESRPNEEGRITLCRWTKSSGVEILLKAPFSVHSRVHEYGGGEWCLADQQLYFVNATDQQIYECDLEGTAAPRQITDVANSRFADLQYDGIHDQLVCISEEHTADGNVINRLVNIDISDGKVETLHEGRDFYASPTISGDGTRLAWLSWNHPHMPWDSTQLSLADRNDQGHLRNISHLTGNSAIQAADAESMFQPQFSPNNELYCITDHNGWWNIHSFQASKNAKNVCIKDAEFGLAQWCFGLRTYDFLDNETIVASYMDKGENHLALISGCGK